MDNRIDEIEKTLADIVQRLSTVPPVAKGYVTEEPGTSDGVKSFGDFLVAVYRDDKDRLQKHYKSIKDMNTTAGSAGGYTVPPEYAAMMLDSYTESEIVYPRARVIPMSARELNFAAVDVSGDFAEGSSTGHAGMVMNWVEEGGTISKTQPKFREMKMVAHKLSGMVPVTDELLNDNAINLESWLIKMFGEAISYSRDYAFLRGDGVGKPEGVLNSPALIQAGDGTLDADTVIDMYKHLHPTCHNNAVWVVNSYRMDDIIKIQSTNNTMVTWLPNYRDKVPGQLLGFPILWSEKIPTEGENSVLLADFSKYTIGERSGVQIALSEHYDFSRNNVYFRATYRVDGQSEWNSSIKTGLGSDNRHSCFVSMAGA